MIFYCDSHDTTHSLTPGQTERAVYALSCEVATAQCEPDGDRINAGDNAWDHFPCVLDYLGLSNSPEGYLEHVDPWVDARRAATPPTAGQPDEAAIIAAADAYGIAPDEFNTDDVRTALRLWEAIRPQFDPNDAWEYTEIGPLLRTFIAVLAKYRPEHFANELANQRAERERQLTSELYRAVYPGDAWPDRPLDTVWAHLLDQVRAQADQHLALRAAALKAAENADAVTGDNASLVEINESLNNRLRETSAELVNAGTQLVQTRRERDEAANHVTELLNLNRDLQDESARLRLALEHPDQIARIRAVLGELSPTDAANTVRGLEKLIADYDRQQLIENTPDDDDEFVGFHG